jgi:hypothetical protein
VSVRVRVRVRVRVLSRYSFDVHLLVYQVLG